MNPFIELTRTIAGQKQTILVNTSEIRLVVPLSDYSSTIHWRDVEADPTVVHHTANEVHHIIYWARVEIGAAMEQGRKSVAGL